MSLILLLMQWKSKGIFWYPCPLYPIRTENSIKRRAYWLLLFLVFTAVCACVDEERREWTANCKNNNKAYSSSKPLLPKGLVCSDWSVLTAPRRHCPPYFPIISADVSGDHGRIVGVAVGSDCIAVTSQPFGRFLNADCMIGLWIEHFDT